MTETAKERIYREKLELISDKSMWHMNFKSSTIKMMMKNAKQALELAENLPDDTDKLSVEKLQEQLNTAKKALSEIAEIIDDNIHECNYGCDNSCELNGSLDMYSVENVQSVIDSALAEIGNEGSGDE